VSLLFVNENDCKQKINDMLVGRIIWYNHFLCYSDCNNEYSFSFQIIYHYIFSRYIYFVMHGDINILSTWRHLHLFYTYIDVAK
jgi:hypothetical protein